MKYDFHAAMIFSLGGLPSPFPPARRPQSIIVPPSQPPSLPSNCLILLLISPSHTRQRRSFIAQHSWRPLHTRARPCVCESACVFSSHRTVQAGEVISPLQRASSLLLLLSAFPLWSDKRLNQGFLPATLLWHKCVQMCFLHGWKKSERLGIIWPHTHTHSSAVSYCISALSAICVHRKVAVTESLRKVHC